MLSWIGMLSATDHRKSSASTISFRFLISSTGQTSPLGTSCSAVTIPVAPVWRISFSERGSFGPNHLQVCSNPMSVLFGDE